MNRTVEHCLVAGPLGTDGDVEASLRGDAFDVSLRRYTLDETREGGLDVSFDLYGYLPASASAATEVRRAR